MEYLYGTFSDEQFEKYKVKLHKELFWLLLYKDPSMGDKYSNVNFDKYFDGLLRKLNGLNRLLSYPTEFVNMMAVLEAAKIETEKSEFDYKIYRKLILDAHTLVDRLGGNT